MYALVQNISSFDRGHYEAVACALNSYNLQSTFTESTCTSHSSSVAVPELIFCPIPELNDA